MKRNTLNSFIASLLFGSLLLTGCAGSTGGDAQASADPEPAPQTSTRSVRVETMLLETSRFRDIIELTGTVEAFNDAALSAQTAGTVTSIASLGQRVAEDAVVAQFDSGILEATVQQAEAGVSVARAQFDLAADNFKRQQPLYRDSIISAIEFETVRAQYTQAEAQMSQANALLNQAKEQLKYTAVRAPFSGVIEERMIEKGEQVMPGTPVVRIVNTNRVRVKAGVPERYARDIKVGTPVDVRLRAYGGEPQTGRVTFVGNAVNPSNRTFPVEISLGNQGRMLKPQMVTDLFITREERDGVLVVPRSAIIRDENGSSVYVVTQQEDGTPVADYRLITLGSGYGNDVVVESGLGPGDEVVVVGQTNLTAGDRIEVVARREHQTGSMASF